MTLDSIVKQEEIDPEIKTTIYAVVEGTAGNRGLRDYIFFETYEEAKICCDYMRRLRSCDGDKIRECNYDDGDFYIQDVFIYEIKT